MDNKSKEFLKLQEKWYKKLKSDGFEDIEQDEEHLTVWHTHLFNQNYDDVKFQAKEDYYRAAGHFLHDYPFKNKKERLIWQLHSEGISIRHIVKKLKSLSFNAYRREVHEVVMKLTREMINKCR
jgi:hypothetical protein